MKEKNIVLIVTLIFLILGLIALYSSLVYSKFNFYSSKITIDGKTVQEKLHYSPDKPYHTLFRNFYSKIFLNSQDYRPENSIGINSVSCSQGTAYIMSDYDCYTFPGGIESNCLPYTEDNEYGCTFGDELGFQKGEEYSVEAEYEIHPENLFKINNKYYIKFIVYSKDNHKFLITGKNFIIPSSAISRKYYFQKDDVIIYVPYDRTEGFNIINQKDFLFDTNYLLKFFALILSIIPALSFYLIWFLFGKELTEPDLPEELSMAPNARKAWEVAAFFNPPFSGLNKNFFASLLLDFYRRKIIDLKAIKEKLFFQTENVMYLRINKIPEDLDEIEAKFMELLHIAEKEADKKHRKEGYFNLEQTMESSAVQMYIKETYEEIDSKIKEERKKYMSKGGFSIIPLIAFIAFFASILTQSLFMVILYSVYFLLSIIIAAGYPTVFIRFKRDYYAEYLHWQAFKKYLSYSYTISSATHETIVMWEEYLLYATALGIPERVLEEGGKIKIVDKQHIAIYSSINNSSASFSGAYLAATGHGGHGGGGGFGGAGGGGVGGGGGGGR